MYSPPFPQATVVHTEEAALSRITEVSLNRDQALELVSRIENVLAQPDAGCIRLEIDCLEYSIDVVAGFDDDFAITEWYGGHRGHDLVREREEMSLQCLDCGEQLASMHHKIPPV
jgi:hypothetical protein